MPCIDALIVGTEWFDDIVLKCHFSQVLNIKVTFTTHVMVTESKLGHYFWIAILRKGMYMLYLLKCRGVNMMLKCYIAAMSKICPTDLISHMESCLPAPSAAHRSQGILQHGLDALTYHVCLLQNCTACPLHARSSTHPGAARVGADCSVDPGWLD